MILCFVMDDNILLYNRYYNGLYLHHVKDNVYQLMGPDDAFLYMSVGYTDNKCSDIKYIDPAGGPYLGVGTTILERTISKIYVSDNNGTHDYFIEIEK